MSWTRPEPLELRIYFRDRGWRWRLADTDAVELWKGQESAGRLSGEQIRAILEHHLWGAEILGELARRPDPLPAPGAPGAEDRRPKLTEEPMTKPEATLRAKRRAERRRRTVLGIILLTTIGLSGCATPIATLYVRPADGAAVRCDASGFGWGLMGLIAILEAARLRDNCIRDAITLGFVPVNGALPRNIDPPPPTATSTPAWIRDLPSPRPTWCGEDMLWTGRQCSTQPTTAD